MITNTPITNRPPRFRRAQLLRELYQVSLTIALLKRVLVVNSPSFAAGDESTAGGEVSTVPPYLRG